MQIQKRVIAAVLASDAKKPQVPLWLRVFLRWRVVRNVPARLIGYGFRRDDVERFEVSGRCRRRPLGVVIDKHDGLLVADDIGNTVWRVSRASPDR